MFTAHLQPPAAASKLQPLLSNMKGQANHDGASNHPRRRGDARRQVGRTTSTRRRLRLQPPERRAVSREALIRTGTSTRARVHRARGKAFETKGPASRKHARRVKAGCSTGGSAATATTRLRPPGREPALHHPVVARHDATDGVRPGRRATRCSAISRSHPTPPRLQLLTARLQIPGTKLRGPAFSIYTETRR